MTARPKLPTRERQIVMKGRVSHRCTVIDITRHEDGRLWGYIRAGYRGRTQVRHERGRYWTEMTPAVARKMRGAA